MAFVITQACVSEVYASCVQACPVDCIHFVPHIPAEMPSAGEPSMVIDPDACIDCGACYSACPIGAIVDSPDQSPAWAQINQKLALEATSVGAKAAPRSRQDPPRRPENRLVRR